MNRAASELPGPEIRRIFFALQPPVAASKPFPLRTQPAAGPASRKCCRFLRLSCVSPASLLFFLFSPFSLAFRSCPPP